MNKKEHEKIMKVDIVKCPVCNADVRVTINKVCMSCVEDIHWIYEQLHSLF